MFADSVELLFSSERAELVRHYPPASADAELITGIFEESTEASQQDGGDGLQRVRHGRLVLPEHVVVSIGKHNSTFAIGTEVWQAHGVTRGRGLQTVLLMRRDQSTLSRVPVQRHQ